MPYKYLDHEADVGILATGSTIGEAFEEGAKAMFNVMVDIDKVQPKKRVLVSAGSERLETLFVEWLNTLLAKKDLKNLVFSRFKVQIRGGPVLKLSGEAWGEELKPEHNPKTEVKAATYAGLKYDQGAREHRLQCVLDI